jgi:hypothetical protein
MPPYPIGTPGVPWGDAERLAWRARVEPAVTRSYRDEVVAKIDALRDRFDVVRYGALPYDAADPDRYPLFAVKTRNWSAAKPCVLVTGGVHGYETSGVQGALRFLETECANVQDTFNVLVAPCVSPWGYERVQRWNAEAVDPNRSFDKTNPPPAVEAALLAALVRSQSATWLAHFDLHETTDTDESEFRPAKAARDGETCEPDVVPDGFYCVGDAENPRAAFQKACRRRGERGDAHRPAGRERENHRRADHAGGRDRVPARSAHALREPDGGEVHDDDGGVPGLAERDGRGVQRRAGRRRRGGATLRRQKRRPLS